VFKDGKRYGANSAKLKPASTKKAEGPVYLCVVWPDKRVKKGACSLGLAPPSHGAHGQSRR
jgi:hypothetical protein